MTVISLAGIFILPRVRELHFRRLTNFIVFFNDARAVARWNDASDTLPTRSPSFTIKRNSGQTSIGWNSAIRSMSRLDKIFTRGLDINAASKARSTPCIIKNPAKRQKHRDSMFEIKLVQRTRSVSAAWRRNFLAEPFKRLYPTCVPAFSAFSAFSAAATTYRWLSKYFKRSPGSMGYYVSRGEKTMR